MLYCHCFMENTPFILSFTRYAAWLSHRYKGYAEFDDLFQECMLAVIVSSPRALHAEDPVAYIHKVIETTVKTVAFQNRIIKPPDHKVKEKESYGSIIEYLSGEMEETLIAPLLEKRDFEWLYAAFSMLPLTQRDIIGRVFGLEGYNSCSLSALARERDITVPSLRKGLKVALKNLKVILPMEEGYTQHFENREIVWSKRDIEAKLALSAIHSCYNEIRKLGESDEDIYSIAMFRERIYHLKQERMAYVEWCRSFANHHRRS